MRKIIASLLAVVMVVCAFSTMSVSAAEENLLSGATYVYTSINSFHKEVVDNDATLLNDGVVRTAEEAAASLSGMVGVSVELAGSYQDNVITFTLEEAADLSTVVFRGARKVNELGSVNRHLNVAKVEVSTDGLNYSEVEFALSEVAIDGEGSYSEDQGVTKYNQFYDITATLSAVAEDVVGIQVTLNTLRADGSNAYVVQLDEIEAYGPAASDEPSSSEPVSSDEDTTVDSVDTTEDATSDETTEDTVVVAETTYTVTFYDNGDGTGTIKITLPETDKSVNGKVVLATTENLTYIDDSLKNEIPGGLVNPNHTRDGYVGLAANYAGVDPVAAGSVIFSADFNIAEGAEITVDDFAVIYWKIGQDLGTDYQSGECIEVIYTEDVEDTTSEDTTAEDTTAEDTTAEDTTAEDTTAEDTTAEDTTADADTTEESADDSSESTDKNGDAGIAVFAVLAVISAGAVVVLKKRA